MHAPRPALLQRIAGRLPPGVWFGAAALLTLAKLWLTRGQRLYAIGGAVHDDRLFADLAGHLIHGAWLGPYTQLTLAKGPFYPLFIAGNFWTGLPLGLTQQLCYAGACALAVWALRPWLRSGAAWFAAYAALLLNPMSYEGGNLARLMRQNIAAPLALAAVAALVALHARRDAPWRRQWPWALGGGLAFGAFWITREEGVWLVPALLLPAAVTLAAAWRERRAARTTAALALFALAAALPGLAVSVQNARHYGWFGTVEFRATEFRDAYGALARVRAGPELPRVPVTREMRLAAYAASPAFAELAPFLEGDIGLAWADKELFPAEDRQIRGGWFMWALRDAVAAAGHARSAGEAMAFYRRLADEVNRACDSGALAAGPRRSGFLPDLPRALWPELARGLAEFARYFVGFEGFTARPPASTGDYAELRPFRDFTRERVSAAPRSPDPSTPEQDRQMEFKLGLLQPLGHHAGRVLGWCALLAHAVFVVRLAQSALARRLPYPLALAAGAWLAAAACVAINALVHVTSFPNLSPSAMAPAYPLLIVFTVAVLAEAAAAWTARGATRPRA